MNYFDLIYKPEPVKVKGKHGGRRKHDRVMTPEKIAEARKIRERGISYDRIARVVGASGETVRLAVLGKGAYAGY